MCISFWEAGVYRLDVLLNHIQKQCRFFWVNEGFQLRMLINDAWNVIANNKQCCLIIFNGDVTSHGAIETPMSFIQLMHGCQIRNYLKLFM